jgi:hypothetical protein
MNLTGVVWLDLGRCFFTTIDCKLERGRRSEVDKLQRGTFHHYSLSDVQVDERPKIDKSRAAPTLPARMENTVKATFVSKTREVHLSRSFHQVYSIHRTPRL